MADENVVDLEASPELSTEQCKLTMNILPKLKKIISKKIPYNEAITVRSYAEPSRRVPARTSSAFLQVIGSGAYGEPASLALVTNHLR